AGKQWTGSVTGYAAAAAREHPGAAAAVLLSRPDGSGVYAVCRNCTRWRSGGCALEDQARGQMRERDGTSCRTPERLELPTFEDNLIARDRCVMWTAIAVRQEKWAAAAKNQPMHLTRGRTLLHSAATETKSQFTERTHEARILFYRIPRCRPAGGTGYWSACCRPADHGP